MSDSENEQTLVIDESEVAAVHALPALPRNKVARDRAAPASVRAPAPGHVQRKSSLSKVFRPAPYTKPSSAPAHVPDKFRPYAVGQNHMVAYPPEVRHGGVCDSVRKLVAYIGNCYLDEIDFVGIIRVEAEMRAVMAHVIRTYSWLLKIAVDSPDTIAYVEQVYSVLLLHSSALRSTFSNDNAIPLVHSPQYWAEFLRFIAHHLSVLIN